MEDSDLTRWNIQYLLFVVSHHAYAPFLFSVWIFQSNKR